MQTNSKSLFLSLRTEGALLPADVLHRISEADSGLGGLTPAEYHLIGNEKLNEAINRSWNRLQGAWSVFKTARERLSPADAATSVTRERWLLPLFQELGYGRLMSAKAFTIEDKPYAISHLWQHTPIHLVGVGIEIDRRTAGATGAAKQSPHSLVQEFLNRSEAHLWAIVSNGLRLRVLRDNKSLTRQAFIEFDLEAMFEGQLYSDFVVLWLVCHQSRVEAERPEHCWLEKWSQTARTQGTRVLDQLRDGIQQAISALGSGFLAHPANTALREKLRSGALSPQDYYRQLLRTVYRLLFLCVAEDRDLLHDPNGDLTAKERYFKYYSVRRLRQMAGSIRGTQHTDLWQGISTVFGKLDSDGCEQLALPALNSFLWASSSIPDLPPTLQITNRAVLDALRVMVFTVEKNTRRPVDFKNLGAEELGSVYESLLELIPEINTDTCTFELKTASGNERKTTGSYYTPTSLIQCLLDSALDPVLDEAARNSEAEQAILDLKVCDPACGSGHFLIAAAHRIAKRLAMVRTGDEEPSPETLRHALRDVIGRCIYGVDINPMAVELCKVALWMESLEPGKPLSFLDHHIQCGNSLLGTTAELIKSGIPDDAFTPIEGDDKAICSAMKRRNKQERVTRQQSFLFESDTPSLQRGNFAAGMLRLLDIPDDTVEGVRKRAEAFAALVASQNYESGRLLADAWCAAFVWKKTREFDYGITEDILRRIEKNPYDLPHWMKAEIKRLATQYQFFHWHLAFPEVFVEQGTGNGGQGTGFDVVLGNPPWERIKLQEKEWFATRRPDIANAANASARRKLIEGLVEEDPALLQAFREDSRKAEGESHFVRVSGLYPLCGRGDINTYSIFAEMDRRILNSTGRVGCIVPSGIATDDTTQYFFHNLMDSNSLVSLYDFENAAGLFPSVHRSYKFCLLTLSAKPIEKGSDFVFFAHKTNDLKNKSQRFNLTSNDFLLLNPQTKTCPVFRDKRDYRIAVGIAQKAVFLTEERVSNNRSELIEICLRVDNSKESKYFEQPKDDQKGLENKYLPFYEGKMVHQFDHRYASWNGLDLGYVDPVSKTCFFQINPKHYLMEKIAKVRYPSLKNWYIGVRRLARSTDERTVIACMLPYSCPAYSFNTFRVPKDHSRNLFYLGVLNSFILDYLVRQKLGGANLTWSFQKQIPFVSFENAGSLMESIIQCVLELTYTAFDLTPFAKDCGYDGPPFRWNEDRRFLMRCELDAAFFHLYQINREDADYILETFPIVKRKDEAKYGEYRTKRVILEIYDEMERAMNGGPAYQTRLDPPPADPRVAHAPRAGF